MEEELQKEPRWTDPACDGHNWEVWNVMPEWGGTSTYREVAVIVCTFCGIVRKTVIRNL